MQSQAGLPKYPPVFFVRITDSVRRRLVKISRKFTHPSVLMLEHMQNLWLLGAISVANELGIADILRDGPKTTGELALITGTMEDPLYRIMRMLASEGIFKEAGNKKFSNTKVSQSMQDQELRYFIQHTLNSMQFRIFGELMHSVKTGRRASELFVETGVFDHIGKSQRINEMYNKAMTNTSRMQVAAILSAYSFSRFRNIVDVGGGLGFFISALLSKYENMQGTLFDLPQVVADPLKLPDLTNFKGILNIGSGSFFDSVPRNSDLYTLKNILHGWNDADCIRILKNIREAINSDGRLMIIEVIVEGQNEPSWSKMSDIFMMAGPGGRERTSGEFREILEQSGFRLEQIKKTVSPLSLIIAAPV